jgi:hypothetical protein
MVLVNQVMLVSLETFAVVALPAARGAVAVAAQPSSQLPVLLAAAVKGSKARSKVLVFNVLPGTNITGHHQPAVQLAQVCLGQANQVQPSQLSQEFCFCRCSCPPCAPDVKAPHSP